MARSRAGQPGKIAALIRLVNEHESAIEYDWRVRFGLPFGAVFTGDVTWGEAWSLTSELLRDPGSHLAAAVAGWDYPWPRDVAVLADLYDAFVMANTDRKRRGSFKPYPRPFQSAQRTHSKAPTVSQRTVRAALLARGHGRGPDMAHLAEHLK